MSNKHAVSQRSPATLSVAFTWSCCNSAETEVTRAREAGGTRPSCELKPDEDKQCGAAFKGENSCDYVLQAGGFVILSVFQTCLIIVSSQFFRWKMCFI